MQMVITFEKSKQRTFMASWLSKKLKLLKKLMRQEIREEVIVDSAFGLINYHLIEISNS